VYRMGCAALDQGKVETAMYVCRPVNHVSNAHLLTFSNQNQKAASRSFRHHWAAQGEDASGACQVAFQAIGSAR
jgi:hypothetical protein